MIKGNVARVHGGKAMRDDKFDCICDIPRLGEPLICLGKGKYFGMRILRTSPVEMIEYHKYHFEVVTESGSHYMVISHKGVILP